MTDDFSPIEYSWKWSMGTDPPEIRYSIEALSYLMSAAADLLN